MTSVSQELESLSVQGLRRELICPTGIDFSSNDFFGLSQSKIIRQKLIHYLANEGILGSTGSRLVSGHSELVHNTEKYLAQLFKRPAALFFGSGYLANLGVTGALGSGTCEFFSDELNHASLVDGMRLSKSKISVFRHNDLEHLGDLLKVSKAHRKVIVTESIFSMDGDGPALHLLRDLMDEFNAYLILDEAHATGICGSFGLGRAYDCPLDSERTILVHTCGKALGGYGAFVLTSQTVRDLLINKARSFIYSTAPSPFHIIQTKAALTELENPIYRKGLEANHLTLNQHLGKVGIKAACGHILSIPVSGNDRVTKAAEILQRNHFFVRAIRSPTVEKGKERLRLTVKSFHNPELYSDFARLLAQAII